MHAFLAGRLGFLDIARVIEGTLEAIEPPAGARASTTSTTRTPKRAASRASWSSAWRSRVSDSMSWFLAFVGFAVLIILHEFGHFARPR